jgi:HK97 gp10 family phage protein
MTIGFVAKLGSFLGLGKSLASDAKDLNQKQIPSMLDRIAQQVLADAKRNSPVDTGALRASGRVEAPNKHTRIVKFGGAGTGVDYAPAVEYGTGERSPNPFLRKAVLKNKAFYKSAGVSAVDKAFKGGK